MWRLDSVRRQVETWRRDAEQVFSHQGSFSPSKATSGNKLQAVELVDCVYTHVYLSLSFFLCGVCNIVVWYQVHDVFD